MCGILILCYCPQQLRRIRAASNETQSTEFPNVKMGDSVDDFFKDVETSSKEGATLPNWYVDNPKLLK